MSVQSVHIVYVIDSLRRGGKERQFIELVKGQIELNNKVSIITFHPKIEFDIIQELNIQVIKLPARTRKNLTASIKIVKLCKQLKPQIIHTWDHYSTICSILAAQLVGARLINGSIRYTRINKNPFSRIIPALAFLFSDSIVANSAMGLVSFGLKNNQKAQVIYNGFDLKRCSDLDINKTRLEYGINSNHVIGMVANHSKFKDYPVFIKSALQVLQQSSDVCFILIGGGAIKDTFQNWIPSEYKQNFIFTGRITHVEQLVNVFSIGVLATHTEGVSNSVLEYMAFAKPVVASDVGALHEVILHNETGYLVKQSDPAALSVAILRLIKQPALANQMGKKGYERIKEVFSIDRMVQAYHKLYTRLSTCS